MYFEKFYLSNRHSANKVLVVYAIRVYLAWNTPTMVIKCPRRH